MTLVDQIKAIAAAYAEARGLSRSRVSTIVFGDGQILDRLESGSDLTTRRAEGAIQWFSDHWPPRTRWPAGIRRPVKSREELAR